MIPEFPNFNSGQNFNLKNYRKLPRFDTSNGYYSVVEVDVREM
jgi:hypothetical protein